MKRILSIDGGGIRGVIPAVVLTEIERRTGRRTHELFDFVAGTSTGGILALGLTMPGEDGRARYAAADLLRLYEQEGPRIFRADPWHRIHALGNLIEEKYPSDGIEEVLAEYFGDVLLSQALVEVLVTAYDIENRSPYFFKRHRARGHEGWDWRMRQVARATSAAPTYFEPARLPYGEDGQYFALVDGGVFANNPALCGYVEARTVWPGERDFLVLSLGTGQLTRPIPYERAKGWGLAMWAQPILGVVFDGVSDTVDHQLKDLCRDPMTRVESYRRLQVELRRGSDDLDDATRTNVSVLEELGHGLVRANDAEIDALCTQLTT